MNKKFGLLLLSCALLSSCSSFEQASIVDNEFIDTTDANNDGIGAIGDGKKLKQAALLDDPTPITFVQPKLGYQYKIDGDNISVRYVAAISSTNVKAVWTRTIYTNTGAVYKEPAQKTSTKYYTGVINPNNENNVEYAADIVVDDTKPYVGFVVYTLLNVPLATYKDYHLSVSLTLTDINFEKNTITSQVGNVYFGRYTGIRMIGTFNGGDYAYDEGMESDPLGDGKRYQIANVSLNAGDEFVFRDYDATIDYGFDKLQTGAIPMFDEGTLANSIKVLESGTYSFSLNNSNQLTVSSDLGYYILGEFGDDSSRYWKVDTGVKATGTSGNYKARFDYVRLEENKCYKIYNLSDCTSVNHDRKTESDPRYDLVDGKFRSEFSDTLHVILYNDGMNFDGVINPDGVNKFFFHTCSAWNNLIPTYSYNLKRKSDDSIFSLACYRVIGTDWCYSYVDYSIYSSIQIVCKSSGETRTTAYYDIVPDKNFLYVGNLEGGVLQYGLL
ncbi:MAG: hypothetical protein IJ194_00330 [Bacilli bacterium]|nr:hypothetical protein [Bacilli bacterium]